MAQTVAIVQSNYVPWKGYFDLVRSADRFVLYDDVQYTRRDWRNRNRIKTADGTQWLTVPVEVKGKYAQTVRETRIGDPGWADNHLTRLRHAYARAPFARVLLPAVADLYAEAAGYETLSEVNALFIRRLCDLLDIATDITDSAAYRLDNPDPSGRLLDICVQAGATEYLSGPAAKAYLDEDLFRRAGVAVRYMDYSGYPEYPQLHGPFDHAVSVLDLLFMTGPRAVEYLDKAPTREAA
ncbi:MAG: WbqC family protein [Gemmataceae bacterium]|nr:WbqC family protein [Gemmataceae bacterium]